MPKIYNLTDTWTDGATAFDAIKINVTDTASAAESKLIDLQVGGVSQFKVDKDGNLTNAGTIAGLENVDNTSDEDKPVSTLQATAIGVVQSDIDAHELLTNNPHAVTATQVGLGSVDNTSDADKPVSTLTQAAIDGKAPLTTVSDTAPVSPTEGDLWFDSSSGKLYTYYADADSSQWISAASTFNADTTSHESRTDNPHTVTATQVGLGNVDNTSDADKPVSTLQAAAIANAGGPGDLITPVVTPVDPAPVDEGQLWTAQQSCDVQEVNWLLKDYSGTPGTAGIGFDNGLAGGIENTPGTYTAEVYAANVFGTSGPETITVVVNAFTLTGSNVFGDLDGVRAWDAGDTTNVFTAFSGVARYDGGSYVITRSNATWATAEDYMFLWSQGRQELIAFRVSSGGTIDAVKVWASTADIADGTVLTGSGAEGYSAGSDLTKILGHTVKGKICPFTYYNWIGDGAYRLDLEPTPSNGVFDSFGTKDKSWSYGFTLNDDWVAGTGLQQMLTPLEGSDGWHLFGFGGFGIGGSPAEYVLYGDPPSGPYTSSTNGASYNIQTGNWLIASAGDAVAVRYDITVGSGTHYIYVNGVLVYSGTSARTYMTNGPTTDPTLSFGAVVTSNASAGPPPSYDDPTHWQQNISDLWIANNANISAADVLEMADHSDGGLALSSNYADVDFYATLTTSVNVVKGAATLTRQLESYA